MQMLIFDATYEELKPKLKAEFIQFLDTFTLKHATIPEKFKVSFKPFPHRQDLFYALFHDERFPNRDPVGHVRWDFGRRASDFEFEVQSRLIQNNKYSRWSSDHHTVRTKDVKKAIKSALTHIKLWGYEELITETRDAVERVHRNWVEEKSNSTYNMRPNSEAMYKELKNLMAQGVEFITPEFKTAIKTLDEYEEYRQRREADVRLTCVMYALGKTVVSDGKTTNEFDNDEPLADSHKSKLGLLKLVDNAQFIPEVGYKVDANTFWIYNETNNESKSEE
jgi:hypothetical protein